MIWDDPGFPSFIHFSHPDGSFRRRYQSPQVVIAATTLDDVIPALDAVERGVAAGLYAVGYVAYDSAPAFDPTLVVHAGEGPPLLWFGLFAHYEDPGEIGPPMRGGHPMIPWILDTRADQYHANVAIIREAIARGDTYQVNYTVRLTTPRLTNPEGLYQRLLHSQGACCGALIRTGRYDIVSASPELFFARRGTTVTCQPMKGTVSRAPTVAGDRRRRQWLAESEKNRAENVMIVDVVRNDLGRLARSGSIRVPRLFDVTAYPTVHQMTSTVSAELPVGATTTDIFRALCPSASVTGAPKGRAMGLIRDLERGPRGPYCGAVGFIDPDGQAWFNVAIRTVVVDAETSKAVYGAGGGITWDSTADDEYAEVAAKAQVLSAVGPPAGLIETLKLADGQYVLLDRHLARLTESSGYFAMDCDGGRIREALDACRVEHPHGSFRVRLVAWGSSRISLECTPIEARPLTGEPLRVRLADGPVPSHDVFLYHKTTERSWYNKYGDPTFFDVLLWNERDELTEFTRGNLVALVDGILVTPPVHCGLLAGTFRQELLDAKAVTERVLRKADLRRAARLWLVNGLRGQVAVEWAL